MASQQEHFEAARRWQAHYDEHLREVGMRAPEPVLGQSVNDYRREVDRLVKRTFLPQNHDLYRVNYRGLKADALDVLEPQLLEAAKIEAFNPNNVAPGTLREIVTRDPRNNQEIRRFVGQESFIRLPNFGCQTRCYGGYREGRRAHIWDPRTNSWFPYPPQSRRTA